MASAAEPMSHSARNADPRARFWNRIAAKYAAQPIKDQSAYEAKLAMTREHLSPGMSLLEVGCGTGGTALAHAPYVAHVHATDISSNMIAIARRKAAEAECANVSFEVAALDELDARPERYDAVLALSVLHLVPDRDAALATIRGFLKPGGVFVSSTACLSDMSPLIRMALPIGRALGVFPLVRSFGADGLEESLRRAGFETETVWRPTPKAALFIIARKPAD